jgi:hypothetical protein
MGRRHVKNADLAKRHLLTDKMDVDLNVLSTAMLNRVRCHVNCTDIVTEDHGGCSQRLMKLSQKLTYPAAFGNGVSDSPVLRLGTRTRDCSLAFRRPSDQVVAEVHTIPRSGPSCVRASSPVCVRVRSERRRRRAAEVHAEIESAFDVAQNPLHQIKMGLARGMHVEASLLDGMHNVRASKREILQSSSKVAVLRGIRKKSTISG